MRMPELMTEISGVIVEVVAFNRVTSAMVWLKVSNRPPTNDGGVLSATPRRNCSFNCFSLEFSGRMDKQLC